MNLEEVRIFCLSLPGVTEDMPYGDDMVVFRIAGKIFLHMPLEYAEPRISIKLLPDVGEQLRDYSAAIRPAYHLNKVHWNEILVEGYFSDDQLQGWITDSYQLVLSKLPKRVRVELVSQFPSLADMPVMGCQ